MRVVNIRISVERLFVPTVVSGERNGTKMMHVCVRGSVHVSVRHWARMGLSEKRLTNRRRHRRLQTRHRRHPAARHCPQNSCFGQSTPWNCDPVIGQTWPCSNGTSQVRRVHLLRGLAVPRTVSTGRVDICSSRRRRRLCFFFVCCGRGGGGPQGGSGQPTTWSTTTNRPDGVQPSKTKCKGRRLVHSLCKATGRSEFRREMPNPGCCCRCPSAAAAAVWPPAAAAAAVVAPPPPSAALPPASALLDMPVSEGL